MKHQRLSSLVFKLNFELNHTNNMDQSAVFTLFQKTAPPGSRDKFNIIRSDHQNTNEQNNATTAQMPDMPLITNVHCELTSEAEKKTTIELSQVLQSLQRKIQKGDYELDKKLSKLQKEVKFLQTTLNNIKKGSNSNCFPQIKMGRTKRKFDSQASREFREIKDQVDFLTADNAEFRERIWALELQSRGRSPESHHSGLDNVEQPEKRKSVRCADFATFTVPRRPIESFGMTMKDFKTHRLNQLKCEYIMVIEELLSKIEALLTEFLWPGRSPKSFAYICKFIEGFTIGRIHIKDSENFKLKIQILDLNDSNKRFELLNLDLSPREGSYRGFLARAKGKNISWSYICYLAKAASRFREVSILRSIASKLLPAEDDLFEDLQWQYQM